MTEHDVKRQLLLSLHKQLPGAFIQKHADRFTIGIPDLEIALNGVTAWLELKMLHLPTRSNTRIRLDLVVMPAQRVQLKRRDEAGQVALVLLAYGDAGWLVQICQLPEQITVEELRLRANCQRVRGSGWRLPDWFYQLFM